MSQMRRLWTAAGIIAVVILVGFAVSVPHAREVQHSTLSGDIVEVPSVTMRDSYRKGVHTITGSIMAPDACASVIADPSITGEATSSRGILIALTMPSTTGVCLEIPTRTTFETTVAAPASLPISVTVNGIVASTTVP